MFDADLLQLQGRLFAALDSDSQTKLLERTTGCFPTDGDRIFEMVDLLIEQRIAEAKKRWETQNTEATPPRNSEGSSNPKS